MAETTDLKPPTTGERFFAWMRSLRLSREPGWLGGVAAGIGTRLGIDPLIVRGIIVVVAVLGGPALLVYAAAWLLLPDLDDKIHLEELLKGKFESPIAGIGVMVLLALLPVSQGFWFAGSSWWSGDYWVGGAGRAIWSLVLIGAATAFVIWIANRGRGATADRPTSSATRPMPPVPPTQNAPTEDFASWRAQQEAWRAENESFRKSEASAKTAAWHEEHRRINAENARLRAARAAERRLSTPHPLSSFVVIGVALIAGGITTLTVRSGEIQVSSVVAGIAVALGILGLAIVVNGMRGKRSSAPGSVAGWLMLPLIFVLVVPQTTNVEYSGGGYFTPRYVGGVVPDMYFIGSGDVTVDLREYYDDVKKSGNEDIYLFAGSSDVTILLPEDESLVIDSAVGRGDVVLDNGTTTRVLDDDYVQRAPAWVDPEMQLEVHLFIAEGSVTIAEDTE